MKKIALTIAIILGLSLTSFADPNGGGLFQRGTEPENTTYSNRDGSVTSPMLPDHGMDGNQDANGPLGSGIAVLLGLGAAYLVGKKRSEE